MPRSRVIALSALASLALAVPAIFALAQPGSDTGSVPANAPKDPPKGDEPKPGDPPADQPQPGRGRGTDQPGGQRGGDPNMLPATTKQGMNTMQRSLKTLGRQLADAEKKQDNLRLVADLQRGCLGAKAASPERSVRHITDEAKRSQATIAYRKQLIVLMEKLLKLESAILDDKQDDAKALLAEIGKLRDESHRMLGVRD